MNFNTVGTKLIVKPVEYDEISKGGVIIPDMGKELPIKGTVISCGKGYLTFSGDYVPLTVKQDDIIIFPKFNAFKIEIEDNEYYVIDEKEVFVILNKEN